MGNRNSDAVFGLCCLNIVNDPGQCASYKRTAHQDIILSLIPWVILVFLYIMLLFFYYGQCTSVNIRSGFRVFSVSFLKTPENLLPTSPGSL